MADSNTLAKLIEENCSQPELQIKIALDEVTVELSAHNLKEFCLQLRDHPELKFELLMDVCGVDYLDYGISEWATTETTFTGFSRGVEVADNEKEKVIEWHKPRFAVVYHLLSITHNHRLRIRVFPEGEMKVVPTLTHVWISADWFEREAFDLYGIVFKDHPDLRRILTDYGFIGHPFRKDFPLIGNVEARYDANQGRVIYEPVSIEARTLVAKVIRDDNRYHAPEEN